MVPKNVEGGKAMGGKAKETMAVEVAAAAEEAVDTAMAMVASVAMEAGVEAAEKITMAAAAVGETVS